MEKVGLFESAGKLEAIKWAEKAANILIGLGIDCCASPDMISKFEKDIAKKIKICRIEEYEKFVDAVISFGGDGTILSASRALAQSDIPIMGFNVGRLGFLAEFSVQELESSISDLLKGNYRVLERKMIETHVNGEVILALNDFVVEKKDTSHMITLQAFVNEHYIADYRADGLIITTPTGSTAYSLSCGGPILAPTSRVICITPISPHSLTLRPLVISDTNEIKLIIHSADDAVNLVADGQIKKVLRNNDTIYIRSSEASIKLIKPLSSSYYDLLRKKLLWAASYLDQK
jgi:NAD+ kinase